MGHADDLEAIPEFAIGGLQERLFEASGVGVRQVDANHGGCLGEGEVGLAVPFYVQKASASL